MSHFQTMIIHAVSLSPHSQEFRNVDRYRKYDTAFFRSFFFFLFL
jgi:hypothetical protein